MKVIKYCLAAVLGIFMLMIIGFNIWGWLTLGTVVPVEGAQRDPDANRVVMVLGATGSAGDGLLKAAMADPDVERIHVLTRRSSPRLDAGVASGRVSMRIHPDFTDYSGLEDILAEVDTVLWGLGTSSLNVDDATYTLIHVDFPMAFLRAWTAARNEGPRSFHFITGMGTDPESDTHWAREKGRTEREMAALAEGTSLRTFSYRSAYIRPTSERANAFSYLGEWLFRPGGLAQPAIDLGRAMLEISARTQELSNGTLVDAVDSIRYGEVYPHRD